ncbi:MAG: restriction endonuclease subunit S [Idiomarinaceae bacterium]|uniref:restriction endonuclease subunit S n=1 Tax=Idiomarina sp. 28-8 TaxID=1260624 RepID=UPI0002DBFBD3|nr:restriction endonuclease subunit S [Idiomarina sp. 28-8]NWO03457.1 restriction endonuclease subunit S [Idiomarinaceae bacterium]
MDAQQFLAEFGHIANAPGGVERLRELILTLAMQGRLVVPISTDSQIEDNIEQIEQTKQNLIERKAIPRQKFVPDLQQREIPHTIPEHWVWVRFGNIAQHNTGKTLDKRRNTGTRRDYITTSNLYWATFNLSEVKKVPIEDKELEKCTAKKGDLLICEGGDAGRAAVWNYDYDICFQNHVHRARFYACVDPYFAFRLFQKISLTGEINDYRKGMGISSMSGKALASIPFPMPPIEEQSRIVAKVDELMALCDQLEAQQQKRRTLQNNLRQAILQAVAASQSPHELQESWQSLQTNFGQLFSEPEDVSAFKGLILDLAVSGNLSNIEHRNSPTGELLLEAITQRRSVWSQKAEGQEKKEAQAMLRKLRTQTINIPETKLPSHWTWATFLQVSQAVIDCHNKTAPYVANGIHLVRTTDIRNGEMSLTNTKKITEETFDYWARRMPPKAGDIFFTREAPMGEAAIVPENEKVCLGQRTMLIRLFPELFNNRFLLYVIRSPSFQTRMIEAAIGMSVKHLRVGGVEDLLVPVPPKPEQDAIVNIIDSLFEICERFEKQLSKKQRIAENLVTSSVSTLTGITIEQEEEPMKAPQTELVAPVRLGTPPDVKAQAPLATILARHNGEMSAKDLWQRFGGEIDAFYSQLKVEVAHGWILEPEKAEMLEKIEE